VVTSIDSFTPPATANGFTETQVVYHYTMQDIPVWANSAAMRAVFPALAQDASGTATGKATLASHHGRLAGAGLITRLRCPPSAFLRCSAR